ncbi:MAG: LON peptidase substrate-binding domain-containing protein [Gammaproteobacteria bacterium]|nr:LON peptidase substrate-binding domain-containing protein [Gammaproteobacteria bacterium]
MNIPLFPLNTVLYPDGLLPLRIFEPRYLDMISECLKSKRGFGICLISQGKETGRPPKIHPVGTLATIVDFQTNDDGLLGITVAGGRRFRVLNTSVSNNQLLRGEVETLDHQEDEILPAQYQLLSNMLRQVLEKFDLEYGDQHERLQDPYWVGSRLAELLPIELADRQKLLEMDGPVERLDYLQRLIADMEIED